jgi:hypothetical protein
MEAARHWPGQRVISQRLADRAVGFGVFDGQRAPLVPKANAWPLY